MITAIVQHAVRATDAAVACAYLSLFRERSAVLPFLFHSLFRDEREMARDVVDPLDRTTIAQFRELVKYYVGHGYRFVAPADLLGGLDPAGRYAMLTFDDGYYNNTLALPVLEEFGVPAVFFISTNHVRDAKCFWWDVFYRERLARGGTPRQVYREAVALKGKRTHEIEAELLARFGRDALTPRGDVDRPFTPAELLAFSRHPCVHLGNHTADHAILTNYSAREAKEQIVEAQSWLRDLTGTSPCAIAYPNGGYDANVVAASRDAGLQLGFTVRPGKTRLPLGSTAFPESMQLGRFVPHAHAPVERQCRTYRSDVSLYGAARNFYLKLGAQVRHAMNYRAEPGGRMHDARAGTPAIAEQHVRGFWSRCDMKNFAFESLEQRQFLSVASSVAASAGQLVFTQQVGLTSGVQYLTLTNSGRGTLSITSVTLAGAGARRFALDTRRLPKTLAPGASAAVKVTFHPLDTSIISATLRVASNARGTPVFSTTLRGLGTAGLYDRFEPSLQRILDTEQIPDNVGDANPSTALLDGPGRSDEVPMQLMRAAGPGPVRLSVLAVFSYATSPTVSLGWYDPAGGSTSATLHTQLVVPQGNAQTFTPAVTGSGRFYPTGTFGLFGAWPDQPHAPSMSEDALNTWDPITYQGHKLRFYPFKLPNGRVVANAYVVAMEESNNSDFNDAVALITNVTPAVAATNTVVTPAAIATDTVAAFAPAASSPFASVAIPARHAWDDAPL